MKTPAINNSTKAITGFSFKLSLPVRELLREFSLTPELTVYIEQFRTNQIEGFKAKGLRTERAEHCADVALAQELDAMLSEAKAQQAAK